ncbi:MAG: hypothetical protein DRR16_23115 [Candidatus Parabeggiatoa sp. nov. 3]|nr:MAG: hypothetical protein DRR00_12685 [Gammaproteobacteria bacterium]RKZ80859.1 MAG: hypothetical protein DRR16_23115 [Gammaproteobacteria bacterium]
MILEQQVLEAKVVRIEAYGVYLDYLGKEILVLIPELSWKPIQHPSEIVQLDERVRVYIIKYNYETQKIVGSIKILAQESNPYYKLRRFGIGTEVKAKIKGIYDDEATIILPFNIWEFVPKTILPDNINPGDEIEVIIQEVDADQRRVKLKPA